MDWASRAVLSWRLSNTLDGSFCVSALRQRPPACASRWTAAGAGCIERLRRSLEYEDVYLKGYADGREAKAGIASWIFLQWPAPASGAGHRTPMAVGREGTTGPLGTAAVDMMTKALPTCPQPHQQTFAMVG
jgi:putative transposase